MDQSQKVEPKCSSASPSLGTWEETLCEIGTTSVSDTAGCNWTILDGKKRLQGKKEVRSPTFWHSGTSEWCMVLSKHRNVWYLSFHLLYSDEQHYVKATVRATLWDVRGKKYNVYPAEDVRLSAPGSSPKKWLVGGDKMYTVKSDATGVEGDFTEFLMVQGEVRLPSAVNATAPWYRELRALARDLDALLEAGAAADVVLSAGGRELRAHRALLSARSPVFAAMLRHDTHEARTGRVEVRDVGAAALRELLRYAYTGRAPRLPDMPEALLVAADKYDVPGLKRRCELLLARRLSVDSAAATAALALAHDCGPLRRAALRFLAGHLPRVLASEGWADVAARQPRAAAEVLRLVADHLCTKEANG